MIVSRWTPIAVACLLSAAAAHGQDVRFVPGSTEPRVQLTGEHFQITVDGTYFSTPTLGRSLSRAGVVGTDLGFPVALEDRTVLLFGDTVGAYPNGDRFYVSRGNPAGTGDSIGYLPRVDFSDCHYIRTAAEQLAAGRAVAADPSGCPELQFYTNPLRASDEHVFKPLVIEGLAADESQATFRVPTSALIHQDRMYVFHTTRMQDTGPFWLQSVLARSTDPAFAWSNSNPPRFEKLATISSHADIADAANPPAVADGGGKMVYIKALKMDAATLAANRLVTGLPQPLQAAPDVVFVFATAWNVRQSDMYLAAFALRDIESSPASWFYYAGNGRWSRNESDAQGILGSEDVSHHSVTWSAALNRFVLLRSGQRVAAQFARAPWGPWSTPETLMTPSDTWGARLLHTPANPKMVQSLVPIYLRDGTQMAMPDEDFGSLYGPGVLDFESRNADGTVTLYYTLSTWNPYQVFLVSSTFRPGGR